MNQSALLLKGKNTLSLTGYEMVPFSMGDIPREIYLGVAGTVFVDGGAAVSEDIKEVRITLSTITIECSSEVLVSRWHIDVECAPPLSSTAVHSTRSRCELRSWRHRRRFRW